MAAQPQTPRQYEREILILKSTINELRGIIRDKDKELQTLSSESIRLKQYNSLLEKLFTLKITQQ